MRSIPAAVKGRGRVGAIDRDEHTGLHLARGVQLRACPLVSSRSFAYQQERRSTIRTGDETTSSS
jgi:hypothetical protein